MLPAAGIYQALNLAKTENLFAELQKIYDQLPETTCNNCASCCSWGSPPAFFIEYLNLYEYIRKQKEHWHDYLVKSTEYYFLDLVDVSQKCPFLGADNKCRIYSVRPLSCRTYGLLNKEDFEQSYPSQGLKPIAKRLWEEYQIKVPDEIANKKMEWCPNVKNSTGKYLKRKQLAGLISALVDLEARFFPLEVIEQERTLIPYPNHLISTVLGQGSISRKYKIMKEFSDRGTKEQLAPIIERAAGYQF